ncbi:unnamed protein product [Cylindrotheca closterium]|uniref:Uncharacterized protein n=1 Tax=Cylindrotheca closterium TaxID=2856 RepID=A0AAD2FIQ9_9STRA|nr:unnamed protein product [Cylindrotheca closterium]
MQSLLLLIILCCWLAASEAFTSNVPLSTFSTKLTAEESDNNENDENPPPSDENDDDNTGEIARATVKIDDGGSDLTDRFKYKVNALMGVFDPQNGEDDERQEGNILNAMLNFPVRYTFNIVGKTMGDEAKKEAYIDAVKQAVVATAGDDIVCKITPRGKNFVKVQCEAEVLNAGMINTIYDEIEKIDQTVMRF